MPGLKEARPQKYSPWKSAEYGEIGFTIAAEAGDAIAVTIQAKTYNGRNVGKRVHFSGFLSATAAGTALATAPTGNVAVSTGLLVLNNGSGQSFNFNSDSTGLAVLTITDSGTPTFYLHLRMPDGTYRVSGAITFA